MYSEEFFFLHHEKRNPFVDHMGRAIGIAATRLLVYTKIRNAIYIGRNWVILYDVAVFRWR